MSGTDLPSRETADTEADGTSSGLTRRDLLARAAALGAAPMLGTLAGPISASAAPARQDDPATLTIAINGSPSDLDPHSAVDYRSAIATRGPYEGLIGLEDEATDRYVGLIADRWEANPDRSVWTFHIRPGVTFHDGSACDAEAVRLSFERLLTIQLAPYGEITRFMADPAQVTAPDAATVVFDLGKPQPLFEALIASQYGPSVVNAAAARTHEAEGDWGHTWMQTNAAGLGTGPYQIAEGGFEPEERVVLERYDGYWGGWEGEHFDHVVIRVVTENETRRQLIERGETDIIDSLTLEALVELEQNPDLVVDKAYTTEVDYFMLTEAGPLASAEARQAMCYAFPYREVVDGVYQGYGKRAIGPVAELCAGFAPETFVYETDLERARSLFAEAGVAEGTEITLTQESGIEAVKTATQLFAANLEQIGMKLSIETVDLTTYAAMVFGDAPAEERPMVQPWFWWPAYNDAWSHLVPQISCAAWGPKGTNSGYYCNERVDELLAQARDATDPAAYQTALAEVQQIVTRDDPAAIYYLQGQWTTILRKEIAGFLLNPIYVGTYDFHKLRRTA